MKPGERRGLLSGEWRAARVALRFLTRFPVPDPWPFDAQDIQRSVRYYPLAGAALGAVEGAAAAVLCFAYPGGAPAAAVVAALDAYLTGALHLDGLMDSADGLFSYRDREETLRIMKDSRVGAMGALAAVFAVLLRVAAWQAMPSAEFWRAAAVAPFVARAGLPAILAFSRSARPDGMAATLFAPNARGPRAALAALGILAAWLALGPAGAAAAIGAAASVAWFRGLCYARIGGMTGDTLGASVEIFQTVFALIAVLRPFWAAGPHG